MTYRRGFTLTELLIAVAIVLVLMVAIGWIFGKTSETVGTGMALADVSREHRNSRAVMRDDFRNALPAEQQPFVLISSEIVPAFLNETDRLGDRDYLPSLTGADRLQAIRTRDFNEDGAEDPADPVEHRAPFIYDARNHRADRLTFFVSKSEGYPRRTGAGQMHERRADGSVPSSNEAMVRYGLLNIVGNALPLPASLAPAHAPGALDAANNPQNFYAGDWILGRSVLLLIPDAGQTGENSTVSHYDSPGYGEAAQPASFGVQAQVQSSRLDVVGMDLETMRARGAMANWWTAPVRDDLGAMRFAAGGYNYPFETIRWVGPTTPDRAARQVPQFMPGCSQFIVEFAGDYVRQQNTPPRNPGDPALGTVLGPGQDGVPDYAMVGAMSRTIWYGAPRDVNGNGTVAAADNDTLPVTAHHGAVNAPFERSHVQNDGTGAYVAAWQPDQLEAGLGPKLIRITIQLVDSNGRLAEGQAIENIFPMP